MTRIPDVVENNVFHHKNYHTDKKDSTEIVNTILKQMSNISKPQKNFITVLFTTLIFQRGRANFRNLCRYSELCEKTYLRQFQKTFDFVEFNRLAISNIIPKLHTQIAAIDCSYIKKSGKHTYGLDKFYDSKIDKASKRIGDLNDIHCGCK